MSFINFLQYINAKTEIDVVRRLTDENEFLYRQFDAIMRFNAVNKSESVFVDKSAFVSNRYFFYNPALL